MQPPQATVFTKCVQGVENKVPYYMYAMVNELGLDDHGILGVQGHGTVMG